jgi:hypothetical protein
MSTAFAIGCLTFSLAMLGVAVKAYMQAEVEIDW